MRPGSELGFTGGGDYKPNVDLLGDKQFRDKFDIKLKNTKKPGKTVYGISKSAEFGGRKTRFDKNKITILEKVTPQDQAYCDKLVSVSATKLRQPLVISGKNANARAMLIDACQRQDIKYIEKKPKKEMKADNKAAAKEAKAEGKPGLGFTS